MPTDLEIMVWLYLKSSVAKVASAVAIVNQIVETIGFFLGWGW